MNAHTFIVRVLPGFGLFRVVSLDNTAITICAGEEGVFGVEVHLQEGRAILTSKQHFRVREVIISVYEEVLSSRG